MSRIWTVRIALVTVGFLCVSHGYSQTYAGGAGTVADPYQIATLTQLQAMQYDDGTKNYILTADIDASATSTWNSGKGFLPIPTEFVGSFDGQGHSITGLTIKRDVYDVGLFQTMGEAASVRNLELVNVDIQGTASTGALAGDADGIISNVSVTGKVSTTANNVGGLVGVLRGTLRNAWSSATVSGTENVGGIAGYATGASIWRSYSSGTVSGKGEVGGIAGGANSFQLLHSYSRTTLTGDSLVGGLVGKADLIYFANTWAATQITTNVRDEGGLVARCYTNCKAVESYWEKTISGVDSSKVGTLKTTADLKLASTFAATSWDLGYMWKIDASANDGFPNNWARFSGTGTGTTKNPYQIKTLAQLQEMRLDPWGNYKLMNDINASATKSWESGKGFRPNLMELGSLDGNNHVIDSLFINRPTETFVGLFQKITDSIWVKNLTLDSANVTGGDTTGILAGRIVGLLQNVNVVGSVTGGYATGGVAGVGGADIKTLRFEGSVKGYRSVGGVFGWGGAYPGVGITVKASVSGDSAVGGIVGKGGTDVGAGQLSRKWNVSGTITGTGGGVGGIFGVYDQGNLDSSKVTATISGKRKVGGLFGSGEGNSGLFQYDTVQSTINVTEDFAGGLFGKGGYTVVKKSNATVKIVGTINSNYLGGLFGYTYAVRTDSSWTSGEITGHSLMGGLVGYMTSGMDTLLHSWTDMSVTSASTSSISLGGAIGGMYDGFVRQVHSTGEVKGGWDVGGFVGYNIGIIDSCYATGKVTGTQQVGGFAGLDSIDGYWGNHGRVGQISRSYATGDVEGTQFVGGFVGLNYHTPIVRVNSSGSVKGNVYVGGLAGYNQGDAKSGYLVNSYATGTVTVPSTGLYSAGGVAGLNSGVLLQTYASGAVEAPDRAGGLVGQNMGWILYSYSRGKVTSAGQKGGLIGWNGTAPQYSTLVISGIWDKSASTASTDQNASSIGASTSQIKDNAYLQSKGFDMIGVWKIDANKNSGYPILRTFSGAGEGTEASPYKIATPEQLQEINSDPMSNYVLTKNLDLSATAGWNDSAGFTPLARYIGFRGSLDGKGYKLDKLTIRRPDETRVGLFSIMLDPNSIVSNFVITGAKITGGDTVGVVVGQLRQDGSAVRNEPTIELIGVDGAVTGRGYVGGLAGVNLASTIEQSYANVTVKGDSMVGGLVGYSWYGLYQDNYARGSITGNNYVGGLLGSLYSNGYLRRCYFAGKIGGTNDVDFLVASQNSGNYVDGSVYWDKQVDAGDESMYGTGLSTSAMKNQASFEDFDFNDIWAISSSVNNGYPYLKNLEKPTTSSIQVAGRQILQGLAQLRMEDGFVMRVSEEDGLLQVVDLRGNIVGNTTAERLSIKNMMPGVYIARYRSAHGAVATMRFQVPGLL